MYSTKHVHMKLNDEHFDRWMFISKKQWINFSLEKSRDSKIQGKNTVLDIQREIQKNERAISESEKIHPQYVLWNDRNVVPSFDFVCL